MATLEKLRQKGPLMAIIIGFALFAFIFTDLISNIGTISGDDEHNIAEVNGNALTIEEFQERFSTVKEIYEYLGNTVDTRMQETIEEQVWEQMVQDRLLTEQYKKLGIAVSSEEAAAMVTGTNIDVDPTIRQYFSNRETGEFFADAAVEFFKTIDQDPGKKKFGLFLETEMELNKKYSKYITLVSKGLNVTKAESEDLYRERMHMVDFEYVMKKYAAVPDSTLKISDSEISTYYNEHKYKYEQKEARDIAYITFDIVPTEKDKTEALNAVTEYLAEMKSMKADSGSENIITYVNANSETPFNANYMSVRELQQYGLDSTFYGAELGTTVGPYEFGGGFNIARLTAKKSMPDTVGARHILIRPDGAKIKDMAAAKAKADSILKEIKGGKDFAELAKIHGTDGTKDKGGDLDKFTQGQMVQEFNDAVFNNPKGYLGIVETQFGAHVIEVTYQSPRKEKVQVAILEKKIGNVDATEKMYQKTKVFAGKNNTLEKFEAAIVSEGLTKKIATDVTPQTKVIAGFSEAQAIISWMYKKTTEKGMVSQEDIVLDNKYVVVALTAVKEEGTAPLEQVKDQIKAEVAKQKKAEMFAQELKKAATGGKSYADVAKEITGESGEEKNKTFSATRIRIGDEQAVVANAVKMAKDQVSEPITGETGVFIIKVTSVTPVAEVTPEMYENDKQTAQNRLSNKSRSAYNALKEASDINDHRHLFF